MEDNLNKNPGKTENNILDLEWSESDQSWEEPEELDKADGAEEVDDTALQMKQYIKLKTDGVAEPQIHSEKKPEIKTL